jgi:hypothetical protein
MTHLVFSFPRKTVLVFTLFRSTCSIMCPATYYRSATTAEIQVDKPPPIFYHHRYNPASGKSKKGLSSSNVVLARDFYTCFFYVMSKVRDGVTPSPGSLFQPVNSVCLDIN